MFSAMLWQGKRSVILLLLIMPVFFAACATDVPSTQPVEHPWLTAEQQAEIQARYYAPLAELTLADALLPEELRGLVDNLATEDFVVATVDGWPILFSELAFRVQEWLVVASHADVQGVFNTLVEEKAGLSEAAALSGLPSPEDVTAYTAGQRAELEAGAEPDAASEAKLADYAGQYGLTVERYWQVISPYYNFKFLTMQNIWQIRQAEAKDAGRDVDGANTAWAEEYAAEKRLEWKRQVTYEQVTALPVLQFKPDLEQLVI